MHIVVAKLLKVPTARAVNIIAPVLIRVVQMIKKFKKPISHIFLQIYMKVQSFQMFSHFDDDLKVDQINIRFIWKFISKKKFNYQQYLKIHHKT